MQDLSYLHYLHLSPGQPLPPISVPQPARIAVIVEAAVSPDWQNDVSDWIVAYGCRYMCAWGIDCSSWDDSVDGADLEASNFNVSDDRMVMTTWHDNESLEEALEFFEQNATHSCNDIELGRSLILHIADEPDEGRLRAAYAATQPMVENPEA